MIRVTRRYRFSASHRLDSHELSPQANRELYGKCNNPFGHGHDYTLDIAVSGDVDAATGHAVNLPELDRMVHTEVLRDFEEANLNCLPAFAATVPTTEHLLSEIERRLRRAWPPSGWPKLEQIIIRETPRNLFATAAH